MHDKVLFADADMNKADWQTAMAGIVGVVGIGLWWADGAAAIVIGASITRDGWINLRTALGDLIDTRPQCFGDRTKTHPAVTGIRAAAFADPGVHDAQVRVREEGHVFHAEVFIVPTAADTISLDTLDRLGDAVRRVDWKLHTSSSHPSASDVDLIRRYRAANRHSDQSWLHLRQDAGRYRAASLAIPGYAAGVRRRDRRGAVIDGSVG